MKKKILQFAIGILIIGIFLIWVGPAKVIETIGKMEVYYIAPMLVFMALSILLNSLNLYILTNIFRKLSLREAVEINIISFSAGLLALGKLGQLSQIYLLKNKGLTVGDATAITITDKSITLVILAILSAFGAAIFLSDSTISIILILASTIIAIAVLFFSDFGRYLIKSVLAKHSIIFTGFSKAVKRILSNKKILVADIFLTISSIFCESIALLFVIKSLGDSADIVALVLISALTRTISYIPITLSGLGLNEGSFTILAEYAGINKIIALSAMSVMTLINYLLAAIVFVFFSKKQIDNIAKSDRA